MFVAEIFRMLYFFVAYVLDYFDFFSSVNTPHKITLLVLYETNPAVLPLAVYFREPNERI
jgi:hypothetical protein